MARGEKLSRDTIRYYTRSRQKGVLSQEAGRRVREQRGKTRDEWTETKVHTHIKRQKIKSNGLSLFSLSFLTQI